MTYSSWPLAHARPLLVAAAAGCYFLLVLGVGEDVAINSSLASALLLATSALAAGLAGFLGTARRAIR